MIKVVERGSQISVKHPQPLATGTPGGKEHRLDSVMATPAGPKPVGPGLELGLPLGL
jgi:hypothetical protein